MRWSSNMIRIHNGNIVNYLRVSNKKGSSTTQKSLLQNSNKYHLDIPLIPLVSMEVTVH